MSKGFQAVGALFTIVTLSFSVPRLNAQAAASGNHSIEDATKSRVGAHDLNVQEYIKLLRQDVRSQKAKLMGGVMQFDDEDAAKFWPIYKNYQAELDEVNDLRVANILEYSKTYAQMTDEKADELVRNALEYQKRRDALLSEYYESVKQALGATTAARFIQVEHQLLLILDLQIASELPVVGS